MTFNFVLNNELTYANKKLRGWRWLVGLLTFYAVCSIGAIASVSVGTWIYTLRQELLARRHRRRADERGLQLLGDAGLHLALTTAPCSARAAVHLGPGLPLAVDRRGAELERRRGQRDVAGKALDRVSR